MIRPRVFGVPGVVLGLRDTLSAVCGSISSPFKSSASVAFTSSTSLVSARLLIALGFLVSGMVRSFGSSFSLPNTSSMFPSGQVSEEEKDQKSVIIHGNSL